MCTFLQEQNVNCLAILYCQSDILKFCGLVLKDIDLQNKVLNIASVAENIGYSIHHRNHKDRCRNKSIANHRRCGTNVLGNHWQKYTKSRVYHRRMIFILQYHCFNYMVGRYNDIYRVQIPNIISYVCRHTNCSNMVKLGMDSKTLQYLMGYSDISVTMNVYTNIGFNDVRRN